MAHKVDVLQIKLVDDLKHMVDDLLKLVWLFLGGSVSSTIAEGVWYDHTVASFKKRRGLVLPAAAVIRHTMDEECNWRILWALIADVVVEAANLHCFAWKTHLEGSATRGCVSSCHEGSNLGLGGEE